MFVMSRNPEDPSVSQHVDFTSYDMNSPLFSHSKPADWTGYNAREDRKSQTIDKPKTIVVFGPLIDSPPSHSGSSAMKVCHHPSWHDAHSDVIPWQHWNLNEYFWHGSTGCSGIWWHWDLLKDGPQTDAATAEYLDKAHEYPTDRLWVDCFIVTST